MCLNYEGWCRRIDLSFRSHYPHLRTRIFKENEHDFKIFITDEVSDFDVIKSVFDNQIRFITAPVSLTRKIPATYVKEINPIKDDAIPSGFEGMPFTLQQLYNHFYSLFPNLKIVSIKEDHDSRLINVVLDNDTTFEQIKIFEKKASALKSPYQIHVIKGKGEYNKPKVAQDVFVMSSAISNKSLNCAFLERDETLWYENVDDIYGGKFEKKDLYFYNESEKCCFVNFAMFENCNLRNFLMMYDVIYCELPLKEQMLDFLSKQKITKNDIINLCKSGRLIILNLQPEGRMDYGFLREIYEENTNAIISRRAISALCAIDLVELNKSYVLSDSSLDNHLSPLIYEISKYIIADPVLLSSVLLWPKKALRKSLDILNNVGPIALGNYGVNTAIAGFLPGERRNELDFEFTVNSTSIHIAHALNATYFPFYTSDNKYSDHFYSSLMGGMLNTYKRASVDILNDYDLHDDFFIRENPSLSIISMFEVNDYIPIKEFNKEFSSKAIRKGVNTLFSQLNGLGADERNELIRVYNLEVERKLKNIEYLKHGLDLAEDVAGMAVPFLATLKKGLMLGFEKGSKKIPKLREVSEIVIERGLNRKKENREISILSKINRVARLRHDYK